MKATSIVEQLRAAIQADGRPLADLARESGVDRAAVSRFVHGRRGISFITAARLAAYFRLELRPIKKGR